MVLERAQAPLLVVDIARALLSRGIHVPLSSVYAALKRLSGAGVVAVHTFNGGKAHYALASRRFRQRIVCTQTGLEHWPQSQGLAEAIEFFCHSQGFVLQDYTLSVQATRLEITDERRQRQHQASETDESGMTQQGDIVHEDEVPAVLFGAG